MGIQRNSGNQRQTSQGNPEAEEHGGARRRGLNLEASEPPILDECACDHTDKKRIQPSETILDNLAYKIEILGTF